MKILDTKLLHAAGKNGRVFVALHERTYEHNGRESAYFMVTRGEKIIPHEEKKTDAVVVVPIYCCDDGSHKLVCTNEFRIPIGAREIGFPAGLVDEKDYAEANGSHKKAMQAAARRELKEETGLDVIDFPLISPPNLYSSAGLTNESISYVFCFCDGTPSKAGLEAGEDIDVMLLGLDELRGVVADSAPFGLALSKTAWPVMWMFSHFGFPNW